jgi:tRNA A-37 threonylcarbamoyl transferase component Bud32
MSDIYKQKAQKYKYKYLKLKKEYYGGKHEYENQYPYPFQQDQYPYPFQQDQYPYQQQHEYQQPHGHLQQHGYLQNRNQQHGHLQQHGNHFEVKQYQQQHFNRNQQNTNKIKKLAEGGFGCVFCPPIIDFVGMKKVYPTNEINLEKYKKSDYVGKLMVLEEYKKEYKNFNKIIEITKSDHIPELIFAGTLNNININSDCDQLNINPHQEWGYIITSHVGEQILKYVNNNNISLILTNLKDAITSVIKPLNEKGYVHYDLNEGNITVKHNKVYIIDFGTLTNQPITRNVDIFKLYNIVLKLFSQLDTNLMSKAYELVKIICEPQIKKYDSILKYNHKPNNANIKQYMKLIEYDENMYSTLMSNLDKIINLLPKPNNAPQKPNNAPQKPNNAPQNPNPNIAPQNSKPNNAPQNPNLNIAPQNPNPNIAPQNPNPNPNNALQNPNLNKCNDIKSCDINSCNIKLTNMEDVYKAIKYYKEYCPV